MKQIIIPACPIQSISTPYAVQLDVLREDLNHPLIQGNKFRKLKYNLNEAQRLNLDTLLTFGGAYSNHIHATAAAAKAYGFKSIGIIRGEELANKELNPSLKDAQVMGMELKFISRSDYRDVTQNKNFNLLQEEFPNTYILPEGGSNDLAVKGCEEILDNRTSVYNFICVPMGTAGTISGIIRSAKPHQKILGFPALKGADFLKESIESYTNQTHYEIINAYHFGGYAKFTDVLIKFVNNFSAETKIPLEPIYTGKMFYGILDLIENDYFPENSKILAIHTGGLQGIEGFNKVHKQFI